MTFTSIGFGGGARIGGGGSRASGRPRQPAIPSVPGLDAFDHTTIDVWTNGGSFPPTTGQRAANVPAFITGTFLEGSYSRAQLEFGYTHALLTDPTLEIRDGYRGSAGTPVVGDYLAIPAGQTNNWWQVVFSFIAVLPGYGKRRVILADRVGTPGNWAGVV
jgi:hypothetical protein